MRLVEGHRGCINLPLQFDASNVGGQAWVISVISTQVFIAHKKASQKALQCVSVQKDMLGFRLWFVVPSALQTLVDQARLRSYERSKKHFVGGQQFRSETWDIGE